MNKKIEDLIKDLFEKLDKPPDNNISATSKYLLGKDLDNINNVLGKVPGKEEEEHDLKVKKFFNYCVEKWKNDKDIAPMLAVSSLLPKIVNAGCYHSSVDDLMEHFVYQKDNIKFTSTREHLWSYGVLYKSSKECELNIPKLSLIEDRYVPFIFFLLFVP